MAPLYVEFIAEDFSPPLVISRSKFVTVAAVQSGRRLLRHYTIIFAFRRCHGIGKTVSLSLSSGTTENDYS